MRCYGAKIVSAFILILISTLTVSPLAAQDATAALSGVITDVSGKIIPGAKISVKNLSTGQSIATQADPSGHYTVQNLAAGDYEVIASADGLAAGATKVTLAAGTEQTLNLTLSAEAAPSENLPNAPSATKTEPSLEDLGFSRSETQANAAQQALLDKRTHMLKIHQRMGLITAAPLIATVILGTGAGGKSEGSATRDLHVALGALTGDLYGITAYYAIRAPRVPGTKKKGPIKVHEALAWIHGPGMILTPILGAMAFNQKNNGEKVHGIASAHGPVAIVTAGAFGAALLAVSVKF
ncbi:MAG: carboxypeptidase-like regulatory domain-containing protein [Candidatus Sulfotelmatobacter sp.]